MRHSAKTKGKKNISEAFFVTRPGFEPRQSEPESEVLPLYYRAIWTANLWDLMFLQKLWALNYYNTFCEICRSRTSCPGCPSSPFKRNK